MQQLWEKWQRTSYKFKESSALTSLRWCATPSWPVRNTKKPHTNRSQQKIKALPWQSKVLRNAACKRMKLGFSARVLFAFHLISAWALDFIKITCIKGWKILVTKLGQYMQDFSEVKHSFISLQLISRDVKIISEQTASISTSESNWAFVW